MTKPRLAKQKNDDGVRTYAWPPPQDIAGIFKEPEFEVVSVTSAIDGGLPKPALIGWAAKVTAESAVKNHAIVGAMLDADQEREAINYLKQSRFADSGNKADRGTIVHAALEAHLAGSPLSKATILEKLEEAHVPTSMYKSTGGMIESLMRFLDAEQPEVYWSEHTVFSRAHKYAGTADVLGVGTVGESRVPCVFDVKTSKAVYDDTALQLAAYARADFVGLDDGSEHTLTPDGSPIQHGIVIRPMASGQVAEKVVFNLTDEVFALFLSCLYTATHRNALKAARRP